MHETEKIYRSHLKRKDSMDEGEFPQWTLGKMCPWSLWSEWGLLGEMDDRFVLAAEHRRHFPVHYDPLDPSDLDHILSDLQAYARSSESATFTARTLYDPFFDSAQPPPSPTRLAASRLDDSSESLNSAYYRSLGYYYRQRVASPQASNLPPVFRRLVRRGVPMAFREHLWLLLSGGRNMMLSGRASLLGASYTSLSKRTSESSQLNLISLDISRTYSDNIYFSSSGGPFRTQRVLAAYSLRNRGLGYCQGLSYLAALLNFHCSEEIAFTLLCVILEDGLVPPDYYTNLTGAVVDQQVLESLMKDHTPLLYSLLDQSASLEDFTVSSIPWFMCLFAATFDAFTAARLWDFLFLYGPAVLFRVALGLLRRVQTICCSASQGALSEGTIGGAADVRTVLAGVVREIGEGDIEEFVELFEGSITVELIESLRERHRADIEVNNSSPCHLTVRQSLSIDLLAGVREDYFAPPSSSISGSGGASRSLRRSSTSRRKKIVQEIDAFLGR